MSQRFHDLLFEVSNENRYEMLTILKQNPRRITDITNEMKLTRPEARRHVSRLNEVGLIQRDIKGYYHITQYGELVLISLQVFQFMSNHRDYIKSHIVTKIPKDYLMQIGKLRESKETETPLDFLLQTENLFKESKEYVWLLVEQFPLNSLSSINEAINRRVRFKIIEPKNRAFSPHLDSLISEKHTHEQRQIDAVNVFLYLSEKKCILAFPNMDGQYDFKGFVAIDEDSLNWCRELFQHYWVKSESIKSEQVKSNWIREQIPVHDLRDKIIVEGVNESNIDAQAVQDAVDRYNEVILSGTFNFGDSAVIISKSVKIRGEGRENGIPKTILYKTGWSFPIRRFTSFFRPSEDEIDVSIENLHFSDFNCAAISTGTKQGRLVRPNSIKIIDNRITLGQGYGRALTYASFGDMIHGIQTQGIGIGGVLIEGNYIDFASGIHARGVLSRGGLEDDPEYRPDLLNHEYFASIGIGLYDCSGKVIVQNNVIRNVSGRGIISLGHSDSSEVLIRDNVIESEVYGSYPFSGRDSATGILAQVSYGQKNMPGYHVSIERNKIKLEKINQSGITILGPSDEGSMKLRSGVIRDNIIQLGDGYEGIHIRKCDEFQISGNKIMGEAYYGIRVSGGRRFGDLDMGSYNNIIQGNDLQELIIKETDDYVLNHLDGKMFSQIEPRTAYYWLDKHTKKNNVILQTGTNIKDDGERNIITYQ